MQSVPITTKVGSSNSAHGAVYSIQHYVIKFVSELWQVGVFSGYSTNKNDCQDITENINGSGILFIHHNPNPMQISVDIVKIR